MAYTTLSDKAPENGTYAIYISSIKDASSVARTPNSLKWHLTDRAGTAINSRSSVAITAPTAPFYITLSGGDLALSKTTDTIRVVTLTGSYTGSEGTSKPIHDFILFKIQPTYLTT